jgi:glucose-1-phosphatase
MQSPELLRKPRFIYFDLGMVLLTFTLERMCRQIAAVSRLDPEQVRKVIVESGLQARYELGELTTAECHAEFCRLTACQADCAAWTLAGSDIFELNHSMVPVVAQLRASGQRLGILSNTCAAHWEFLHARYRLLREIFDTYALSYELNVAKPDRRIFLEAARLAGVEPCEIFFTDDMPGHVAGARAAGFDAVPFTSAAELVAQIRRRGVSFNY